MDVDGSALKGALTGTWRLTLSGTRVVDSGRYDAWLPSGIDGIQVFQNPDQYETVGDPADAHSIISVANYATRTTWTDINQKQHSFCDFYQCRNAAITLGDIMDGSSRGPTADGRQKPDIAAPGTLIFSSLSHDIPMCADASSSGCLDPSQISTDGKNLIDTGTSMSSPHVAGVVALMLQIDPTLDPSTIDSILRSTARHDQFTGNAGWTPTFGAGKVDALAAVQAVMNRPVGAPIATATPRPLAPTATPTQPTIEFRVVTVRAALHSHSGDWSQIGGGTGHFRVGSALTLSIYSDYNAVPVHAAVVLTWRVNSGKKRVFFKSASFLPQQLGLGVVWQHVQFTPRQPGKYSFTGTVSVSGKHQQQSTSFVVSRR